MVTNEAFNALFATAALVLAFQMLRSNDRARLLYGAAFALALAAALLSKVSSIILAPLVGAVAIVQALLRDGRRSERALSAAIPIGALATALVLALPVYAHHHRTSPSILATGFECTPFYREELEELGRRADIIR